MSSRKSYGSFILIASLVIGVLLLIGSYFWMADKANMLLAVFVLILYGIGQWMTVVYWQNIQSDWESTGEVLGRLQKAVSDIPAALDSNLKAIAEKLSEGQQQALSKLQSEVSEGARQTLEKGSTMIGESIAKNFQAPVAALNTMVHSFTDKSSQNFENQAKMLKSLVEEVRQDSKQNVEKGAILVAESLEKNLRGPLAGLEKSLAAWRDQAHSQSEVSMAFGDTLSKNQMAWSDKVQSLADQLLQEFKAQSSASAEAAEVSKQAWSEKALEVQDLWTEKVQALQSNISQSFVEQSQALGQNLSASAQALLIKVESLQVEQNKVQAEMLAELSQGQSQLLSEISSAQNLSRQEAEKNLEAQGQIGLEIAGKVSELADQMGRGSKDLQELANLSQINQVEMQATVGMLNTGLASILERLEKQADAGDGYQTFLSELARALATFQERASDVLIENAMKTQEILMEVLVQNENRPNNAIATN